MKGTTVKVYNICYWTHTLFTYLMYNEQQQCVLKWDVVNSYLIKFYLTNVAHSLLWYFSMVWYCERDNEKRQREDVPNIPHPQSGGIFSPKHVQKRRERPRLLKICKNNLQLIKVFVLTFVKKLCVVCRVFIFLFKLSLLYYDVKQISF